MKEAAGIQKASPHSNLLAPGIRKDMFIRILTIQIADPLCPFVIFDSCISGLQYEELRNLADIYAVKENENIFKSNPEHSIVGSLNVR